MVGAALTASTAIASADSTDDAYLAKLHNLGFTWPSSSDSDMIGLGHAVCSDRMAGKTPDEIAADLHSGMSSKGLFVRGHDRLGQRGGIDLLARLIGFRPTTGFRVLPA